MSDIPTYLILTHKVYVLDAKKAIGDRAFDRDLVDYHVEGKNPMSNGDTWRTQLGMTRELFHSYESFREEVPAEWLLFRFLFHFVRTNSIDVLSGKNGQVLTSNNYKDYIGKRQSEKKAEQILCTIFRAWVQFFPEKNISLADIYASTDLTFTQLKNSINTLIFQGNILEIEENTYEIQPKLLEHCVSNNNSPSFDRISNRYYQEINIVAKDPFCFVIMPFKEKEFPQRVYTEVIKPLVEDLFKINCYRVDEDNLPDRIDNKIYSYLFRSAFVIAEVTILNPNVFYELGLAHMLEKDCIILTKKSISDIPFDINRIRAEYYDSDEKMIEILDRAISALGFKSRQ